MDCLINANFNNEMLKERKILVKNFMVKILEYNHYLLESNLLKDFVQVLINFHLN